MKFLKLLTELSGFSETLFSLVLVFIVIIVVVIRKSNCSTLLSSVLVYACAPSTTMKGIFLLSQTCSGLAAIRPRYRKEQGMSV